MKPVEFWKMNGSGNDFILIDNREGAVEDAKMGQYVKRICRRRVSVGADGVIFVTPSAQYDFGWRFFNADGGEVEMCGNGGRCVSRFAFLKRIAGPKMTFETLTGPVSAEVLGSMVKVRMPKPDRLKLNLDLDFLPGWTYCDFVHTGVPHVVIWVEDLAHHPVVDQGSGIRYHERFSPEGTNANFVIQSGPDRLAVRTYERGVEDETLACGTGAIAAALVALKRNRVTAPVTVDTRGGETLTIHVHQAGGEVKAVWLEGNTAIAYQAVLHEEAL
ncbi:MAG: diaminopimelate epimerase [Desulfatiglandaceae bacterium]